MIASFLDFANSIIEKGSIKAPKNNIVYQWLRKPCMEYCKNRQRLNADTLFYMCFWVMDLVKNYDTESFEVIEELDYFSNYVEELFSPQHYNGNLDDCYNDRMFLLLTLAEFARIFGDREIENVADFIEDRIEKITYTNCHKDKEFLYGKRELMRQSLTDESLIYQRGDEIYNDPYIEDKSNGLFDYLYDYYNSDERLTENILQQNEPGSEEKAQAQIEQLQAHIEELEKQLAEKEETITALRKAKESADEQVREAEERALLKSPIRIAKGYKQRAMVLLSAMFYAHYFDSTDDSITNRDHFVQAIMQYGFGDTKCNSIRQSLDNYEEKNGDLNELKKELRKLVDDALDTLVCYQNEEKKTTKTNRRI